jgi:cysteine desulfurase/selenocysteine lyase
VPFGALPPGANLVPTSPQAVANIGAPLPARVPHAVAPNGAPDLLLTAAPALDGRWGSHAIGVPPLPAVPLPHASGQVLPVAGRDAPIPSYYFLDLGVPRAQAAPLPQASAAAYPPFDLNAVRRDFPILSERVNGRPLVWFDNAATTQKPQAVIDRLAHFYAHENSNIHRAAHELAARATDAYEGARETVRRFINAASTEEIIFVRGATEAINLVAKSWGAKHVGAGDEIIVSQLEHHANIVPWQQLAAEKGATLRVIPVDDDGQLRLDEYQRLLNERSRIVAVTQVSNALGTVVPVQQVVQMAHRACAKVLVDGAQSVSHLRVDVQSLDADFFVFSGHKIFGPTGIGVVYGKRAVLEDMPPWQGGGNMIADVTFERTVYHGPPTRFEAGTGNIADAVGLGAALEYVERLGIEAIGRYEHALLEYATAHLRPIPGVRLVGTAPDKASVLSFVLAGYSTDEVGRALNQEGIAVRTGHHCAQPILRRFGLETSVRPSLAFYNTCEEVDRFIAVVRRLALARG